MEVTKNTPTTGQCWREFSKAKGIANNPYRASAVCFLKPATFYLGDGVSREAEKGEVMGIVGWSCVQGDGSFKPVVQVSREGDQAVIQIDLDSPMADGLVEFVRRIRRKNSDRILAAIMSDPAECYGYKTPDGEEHICYWGFEPRGAFVDLYCWDTESKTLERLGSFRSLAQAKVAAKEGEKALAQAVRDLWEMAEQDKPGEEA